MNIKLIKAEIEKLSLMLSSWEGEESVSAIERDIALDKLKKIYDLVRFNTDIEDTAPAAEPTFVPTVEPTEENDDEAVKESDVEVELVFADEEDFLSTLPDADEEDEEDEEPAEEASSLVSDILASAMTVPVVVEAPKVEKNNDEPIDTTPIVEQQEPEINPEPAVEESVASESQQEVKPIEEQPAEEKRSKREEPMSINSLFGVEEVQRRPRTKHQRMMSIYNDSEPAPEKVVDISKIFDMDIEAPKPLTAKSVERKTVSTPTPKPAPITIEEEHRVTIADAMATTTQTLADTIAAPNALAEEIHHSKIASLRDGIGLNDKFLMIRDLFDGDGEAYDEAITALDSMETLDDCMIHIIENYAWNPDTEGSKFIMQLLERKLS